MGSTTEEKAVVFNNVEKKYTVNRLFGTCEITAFKDLSFSINKGVITGLLGLNGAGKTTILKLTTGLLFCTSGTVSVFGRSPLSLETKKLTGFLPELPYFSPFEKPLDILKYYGALSGMKEPFISKRAEEVLEITGLSPHKEKKTGQFSKGMLQRLGIAQAIMHEPELLILDEPASGLDPLAVRDIRQIISDTAKKGTTVLLSSHSISEVEKICSEVLIMKEGRLARTVQRHEWETGSGLEEIFINTVRTDDNYMSASLRNNRNADTKETVKMDSI